MLFKIESGTIYICDQYGFKLRKISEKVNYAVYDDKQKIFLITFLNGDVKTADVYGFIIRKICENGNEAKFWEDKIHVRTKDGKNELRDKYGFKLRNI